MPEYTLEEVREQARKAGVYFGKTLVEHNCTVIAVETSGVVIVVAIDQAGQRLERLVKEQKLNTPGAKKKHRVQHDIDPPPPVEQEVILIPRYHEPSGEFAKKKAHVHLHVLNDAKLGRRVRKSGECLCGKKHGSKERTPQPGETTMCAECMKVATENGLTWTL